MDFKAVAQASINTLLLQGALPDQEGTYSYRFRDRSPLGTPGLVNELLGVHWFFYGLILPLGFSHCRLLPKLMPQGCTCYSHP